ncbi:hypothetical protein KUCAC02_037243, partial [Chaenocephalus aceratus]
PSQPLPRITNENRHYYHVRPVPALSTLLAPHADSECVLLGDLNGTCSTHSYTICRVPDSLWDTAAE